MLYYLFIFLSHKFRIKPLRASQQENDRTNNVIGLRNLSDIVCNEQPLFKDVETWVVNLPTWVGIARIFVMSLFVSHTLLMFSQCCVIDNNI